MSEKKGGGIPEKRPRLTKFKLRMIKPLYKKFNSYNHVSRVLGVNHTTVMYWLGKLKNKNPKKKLEDIKILPEDYKKQLYKINADTPNPKEIAQKLREEFKDDFGVYPEEYGEENNKIKM